MGGNFIKAEFTFLDPSPYIIMDDQTFSQIFWVVII